MRRHMAKRSGALPSQTIKELMQAGCIINACENQVQPASIDLTLSNEVYRMSGLVMPKRGERVADLAKKYGYRHQQNFFERGATYLVRLRERLNLVQEVYGLVNPKSTTGRLDLHVRLVADGVQRFDTVPRGYREDKERGVSGELWLYVTSRSFPIKADEGTALTQLRFFTDDARLDRLDTALALKEHKLLWSPEGKAYTNEDLKISDQDGMLILTIDMTSDPVGWRALRASPVLDMAKRSEYAPKDFFEPVHVRDGDLYLDKGFYILSSEECVRVPPHLACEMQPTDDKSGEFRAHYAGFIDPGWGWGKNGESQGRRLTLEVRPHEDNLIVRKNRPIAKIGFERMAEIPEDLYDTGKPNYGTQKGPQLAKQFKQ